MSSTKSPLPGVPDQQTYERLLQGLGASDVYRQIPIAFDPAALPRGIPIEPGDVTVWGEKKSWGKRDCLVSLLVHSRRRSLLFFFPPPRSCLLPAPSPHPQPGLPAPVPVPHPRVPGHGGPGEPPDAVQRLHHVAADAPVAAGRRRRHGRPALGASPGPDAAGPASAAALFRRSAR